MFKCFYIYKYILKKKTGRNIIYVLEIVHTNTNTHTHTLCKPVYGIQAIINIGKEGPCYSVVAKNQEELA